MFTKENDKEKRRKTDGNSGKEPKRDTGAITSSTAQVWDCRTCTYHNTNPLALACFLCWVPRDETPPAATAVATVPSATPTRHEELPLAAWRPPATAPTGRLHWQCKCCTLLNDRGADTCAACAGSAEGCEIVKGDDAGVGAAGGVGRGHAGVATLDVLEISMVLREGFL